MRVLLFRNAVMTLAMPADPSATAARHRPMGAGEFVALVASLMALNALAVDIMLPALPVIGQALGVADDNQRQFVLTSYLLGFGVGQLLIGSVSDRFGRRPVLLSGLAVYVGAAAVCALAPTFAALLAARMLQGVASACPRVITTSIVRDCYAGRHMARVMSLAMTVFMAVPVLAPSIGQLIVLFAPWRAIFGLLTFYGLAVALWVGLRLPETLPREARRRLSPKSVIEAFGQALGHRQTLGYTLAGGLMFGAMFGFLVSAQQIFTQIFKLGVCFPLAFAAIALCMSFSSFLNSRLVGRYDMRVIAHGAVLVFVGLSAIMAALAWLGWLSLIPFMALFAGAMFLIGMIFSNFNALAMEPQGHIAGTASSLIGSLTTLIAAVIGGVVGSLYNGTLAPLTTAYQLLSSLCLLVIAVAEKGTLLRRDLG